VEEDSAGLVLQMEKLRKLKRLHSHSESAAKTDGKTCPLASAAGFLLFWIM
jgi:hypothetical protein